VRAPSFYIRHANMGGKVFTRAQIDQMTAAIVQAVKPLRIVLFGSYARGDSRPGSDVDFLVVERDGFSGNRGRWGEMATIRRALRPFRGPKDVLVFSDSEVRRLETSSAHVVGEAMRDGKVLYEHAS
jgi:predicted nucleotidyltransferase